MLSPNHCITIWVSKRDDFRGNTIDVRCYNPSKKKKKKKSFEIVPLCQLSVCRCTLCSSLCENTLNRDLGSANLLRPLWAADEAGIPQCLYTHSITLATSTPPAVCICMSNVPLFWSLHSVPTQYLVIIYKFTLLFTRVFSASFFFAPLSSCTRDWNGLLTG